ncbi:MAG: apolipoprotein N-acyltransferase [Desulfobacterales bacterium]|nr:apolipoprotein N-acyltransferase [Desulfobacterales bacterium]
MKTTDSNWKRMGGAAVSGLLLTAAFPKVGFDFIAWVALVPLLAAIDGTRWKAAFRVGFAFGLVHYLSLVYWVVGTMQTYGHLPLVLAFPILFLFAAYLALYPALFSVAMARISMKPALIWPATAVFWTAQEFLRARLFTGFPWELLGYSQFERVELIQIADVAGVYGVTFLVALANGALYSLWQAAAGGGPDPKAARRRAAAALTVAAVAVGAGWLYGSIRIEAVDASTASADAARITLIQGNIAQEIKWDRNFQFQTTGKYAALSVSAAGQEPDLVVWPETAAPFYFPFHAELTRIVLDAVEKTGGADFLIGSPSYREKQGRLFYYNSAYLVSSDGAIQDRYDKVHLVPFGEYVPFKRYLPFLGKIVEHVGDFDAGPMGKVLAWKTHRLGVLICYESIFPALARAQASAGADLLVNITNDAWYGRSSAPFQHFSMAVFRAVENRRSLARAANTGISGFIDPAGRVTEASALFTDAVMTRTVPLLGEAALYTRFGDVFAYLCLAAAALLLLVAGRRAKRLEI